MYNLSINISSRWNFLLLKQSQKQNHLSYLALMAEEILLLFSLKSKRLEQTAGTHAS